MITFVTWKWGFQQADFNRGRVSYTAEHVNKMCSMLEQHYQGPHRVVCLTDDPSGIECETQEIPAPALLRYGGCWHRLWLFSPEATRLGEELVSIDLDTVIVDRIDGLFAGETSFKIWRGSYEGIPYCGSLWQLRTGTLPWVWAHFDPRDLVKDPMRRRYYHPACRKAGLSIGTDQTWLALKLPGAPVWTSIDGVVSYRLDAKGQLPSGAKIVNFHGLEDPSLPNCQQESPWITEHWK